MTENSTVVTCEQLEKTIQLAPAMGGAARRRRPLGGVSKTGVLRDSSWRGWVGGNRVSRPRNRVWRFVRIARFPNPGTLFADCPQRTVCPYIAQHETDTFR